MTADREPLSVQRVQTGVRIEARLLNVLKALAALKNMSLGDLLEGIVLHAFEGKCAFGDATLEQIAGLRSIYGLTLAARDSHRLVESEAARQPAAKKAARAQRGRKAR